MRKSWCHIYEWQKRAYQRTPDPRRFTVAAPYKPGGACCSLRFLRANRRAAGKRIADAWHLEGYAKAPSQTKIITGLKFDKTATVYGPAGKLP